MVTPRLLYDKKQDSPFTAYLSYIDSQGNFNPGNGWTLAWSDEFNGSSINADNWVFDIGNGSGGWGNNELEYYTDRADNAFISNGCLVIKAVNESYGGCSYTSARLKSIGKQSWQYGKIVAKMKLPYGQGLWPAFWVMGNNYPVANWPACGEIDIMELVGGGTTGDRTVTAAAHWNNGGHQYQSASYTALTAYSQSFHYFEMEWTKNFIRISVDAVPYFTLDITPSSHPELSAFQQPFYILMNIAIGGNWPGNPDGSTVFPQAMTVDWVRVFQADLTIPSLSFSSPADRSVISGGFSITGTASSGGVLEGVYLSVDGGAYSKVAGLESWSNGMIFPITGNHVIRAYAKDTLDKCSVTNELNVTVTSKPISIYPTYMPPINSSDNILGRVDYANPADYKICVFIYVAGSGGEGGWWVKPTSMSPYTGIAFDGSWSCDYTTGGNDPAATGIRAFVVRNTYAGAVSLYNISANAVASFLYFRDDTAAPACSVSYPSFGASVENTSLSVSGSASDNRGVNGVYISVNGSDYVKIGGTDSGTVSLNWNYAMSLVIGANTVKVFSKDFGGHTSATNTVDFTCTGDISAPSCAFTSPASDTSTGSSSITISGSAQDNISLEGVYISVNGSSFVKVPGTDIGSSSSIGWSYSTGLNPGANSIRIYARDYNGNISSTKTISIAYIPQVVYQAHVEGSGWQSAVTGPNMAGSTGQYAQVEAVRIWMPNAPSGWSISASAFVERLAGLPWYTTSGSGMIEVGTTGQGLQMEAIYITLNNAPGFSITYRVHVAGYGWLAWVQNGERAGTTGEGRAVEAIEIQIIQN